MPFDDSDWRGDGGGGGQPRRQHKMAHDRDVCVHCGAWGVSILTFPNLPCDPGWATLANGQVRRDRERAKRRMEYRRG